MKNDTLFLLEANSVITDGVPGFCPDCAMIEGYLSFYPGVRAKLNVRYVPPPRPRSDLVELLGETHQGAPVLILAEDSMAPADVPTGTANGHPFVDDPAAIVRYLAARCGGGLPL